MKNILVIHERDIVPDAVSVDRSNFSTRAVARAVVIDDMGRIALLHVGLYGYHKLPGGGIEGEEDMFKALERELMEEIGCRATITGEVGEITEYRDQFSLKQTSYCFIARQVGERGVPDFTEEERQEQFSVIWADHIDSAISLLEQDAPTNYEGKFIRKRDLAVLKAAKQFIS